MEKIPMTAAGHAALESELKRRTSEERPRIIEPIAEARGHGDLPRTPSITPPRKRTASTKAASLELEDQLSRAEVIDVSKLSGSKTIKFGATVTLVDEDTEEKKKYQIVGDVEADVKDGTISISSPIARALIGKAQGRHRRGRRPRRRALLRDPRRQVPVSNPRLSRIVRGTRLRRPRRAMRHAVASLWLASRPWQRR